MSGQQDIRFCTSSDGTRIAYATAGSGPPLVRVTNWLSHLEMDWEGPIWSPTFDQLSRDHTLVRYDLRGSGLSDRSVDDLSLNAWVRDLDAVVDDLGLERFSLYGSCQGGDIAVAYAARRPKSVRRLVLSGAYTHGGLVEEGTLFEHAKTEALAQLIKVGWGRQNAAFRKVFAGLLVPEGSEEQKQWLSKLQSESASPEMAARLWRTFHEFDIRPLAPKVQTPTLVFHVTNDSMVPFQMGRRLASLIPDARFVPLEGENHILLPEEPAWERFVSKLHDFLSEEEQRPLPDEGGFRELTPRECEVLDLLAQGLSNHDIADELCISSKTVRNHVSHIFDKLNVSRRAEAIVQAREAGLGRTSENQVEYREQP